ncbi:MAG: hypothetical protein J6328_02065 [Bacilli bacterium]|nr:hypothetical protein [Bacilli bacterium]
MEEKKSKKLAKGEKVVYTIAACIALIGLTFIVFGLIGSYYPGKDSDNWVAISEKAWLSNWSHLGYRWWGVILLLIGTLVAVIGLTAYARSGDRDEERAIRRKQRLGVEALAAKEVEAKDVKKEGKEALAENAPKKAE